MEQEANMENFTQPDGTFKIDGEMMVSEVITAFPKAASVLMSYGLHCVGCAANAFDTIEGGAKLHGMSDEEIAQMIADVNTSINKKIETIEMTAKAIAKVKELRSKEEGKETWPLRIAVLPGGCAGLSYDMDFDQQKEGDVVLQMEDLQVLIDKESMANLKGSSIDFVDSLMGSGFKIENPNAHRGCGCGKSFG